MLQIKHNLMLEDTVVKLVLITDNTVSLFFLNMQNIYVHHYQFHYTVVVSCPRSCCTKTICEHVTDNSFICS